MLRVLHIATCVAALQKPWMIGKQSVARSTATADVAQEVATVDLTDLLSTCVDACERGCAEMTELVRSVAPDGDIQSWLDTAKAVDGGCKVCAVHNFDLNEAPKVEREKKRVFEALGGPTKNLRCTFADGTVVEASSDDAFHAKRSTLVFRCPIPTHLGCSPEVSIEDNGRRHETVRVCHTPKPPKVDVALVAWTSASPYTDRAGMVFDATDKVLKRWLAWHWSIGVRYFLSLIHI